MRHPPSKDDFNMISFMEQMNVPFIVVLTKADKLKKKEFESRSKLIFDELKNPDYPVIPFSAVTGLGVDEIKKTIEKVFEK